VAKLGKWLLAALCLLLRTQKSYFKSSTNLTNKLKNFALEENSINCSFDMVSMHLNCNVKKCKGILRIKLQKHFGLIQDVAMASMAIEVIMKLVIVANEYSLYFGFRGEFYKQVFGFGYGSISLSFVGKSLHGLYRILCYTPF